MVVAVPLEKGSMLNPVKSPATEEEAVAQTMCDEMNAAPISCPPVPLCEGGRENRE